MSGLARLKPSQELDREDHVATSDRDSTKEPKTDGKKKLGGVAEIEAAEAQIAKYLAVLKDYQNVVFGAIVAIILIGVVVAYQQQLSQEREDAAWADAGKARDKKIEDLKPLVTKYEGSEAQPFIALAYAAKLYERGNKDDLNEAKVTLERVQGAVANNRVIAKLVAAQLAGITKELGDADLWTGLPPGGVASTDSASKK